MVNSTPYKGQAVPFEFAKTLFEYVLYPSDGRVFRHDQQIINMCYEDAHDVTIVVPFTKVFVLVSTEVVQ